MADTADTFLILASNALADSNNVPAFSRVVLVFFSKQYCITDLVPSFTKTDDRSLSFFFSAFQPRGSEKGWVIPTNLSNSFVQTQ
jgi:hypothetical protein